jgi:hypothetical protein
MIRRVQELQPSKSQRMMGLTVMSVVAGGPEVEGEVVGEIVGVRGEEQVERGRLEKEWGARERKLKLDLSS